MHNYPYVYTMYIYNKYYTKVPWNHVWELVVHAMHTHAAQPEYRNLV